MTTVRLGFEIPTGAPVDIPLRHMVVTGQTQEAGKTSRARPRDSVQWLA